MLVLTPTSSHAEVGTTNARLPRTELRTAGFASDKADSTDADTDPMQAQCSLLYQGLMRRSYRLMPAPTAFTLIELLLVVAIIGVLASLAIPKFQRAVELARIAKAIGDIRGFQAEISSLDSLPTSLAAIGRASYLDPWERPYVYLKLEGIKGKGQARKDHFLVPLNSDYDLYSVGKDGATAAPLTAKASGDDVIRANNGGFVGLASRY